MLPDGYLDDLSSILHALSCGQDHSTLQWVEYLSDQVNANNEIGKMGRRRLWMSPQCSQGCQGFRGAKQLCLWWLWCSRRLSSMDASSILDYYGLVGHEFPKIRIERALV